MFIFGISKSCFIKKNTNLCLASLGITARSIVEMNVIGATAWPLTPP